MYISNIHDCTALHTRFWICCKNIIFVILLSTSMYLLCSSTIFEKMVHVSFSFLRIYLNYKCFVPLSPHYIATQCSRNVTKKNELFSFCCTILRHNKSTKYNQAISLSTPHIIYPSWECFLNNFGESQKTLGEVSEYKYIVVSAPLLVSVDLISMFSRSRLLFTGFIIARY